MISNKEWIGLISVFLGAIGYARYFWTIFQGRTKPHLFTWLIFAIANGIGFAGQISRGGGPGSWTTGLIAVMSLGVVACSFFCGEKNIKRSDWIALAIAFIAIIWWCVTSDPLGAVILATAINIMGWYPTARKSFLRPLEEPLFPWALGTIRSTLSIIALGRYNAVTLILPVAVVLCNGSLLVLIGWRRHVVE